MTDFYAVLDKVIADTKNNPALMRQVIYECARLAAKRQALLQSPSLTLLQVQERMLVLEQAIARAEAEAQQEEAKRLVTDKASQEPQQVPRIEGPDDFSQGADDHNRLPLKDARERDADTDLPVPRFGAGQIRLPSRYSLGERKPDLSDLIRRPAAGIVQSTADATRAGPSVSGGRKGKLHLALSSVSRIAQLTVAAFAAVAIYTALATHEAEPPVPAAPALNQVATVAGAETAAPQTETALGFPLPQVYGVYAISNGRLIELEQVPTAPVDPRTRTVLKFTVPSHVSLPSTAPSFIIYRRDLLTSAPEKVRVLRDNLNEKGGGVRILKRRPVAGL